MRTDGRSDFVLTRAVIHEAGPQQGVCIFDVRSGVLEGRLGRGTAGLMGAFLRGLGARYSTITDWSVSAMATPFYGFGADSPDWRDRVAEAWRVSVTAESLTGLTGNLDRAQCWFADGFDTTLSYRPGGFPPWWSGETVDCVIIADCHAVTVSDPRAATAALAGRFPPGRVTITEYPCLPFSPRYEARVTLPKLRLSEELDQLQQALDLCGELGMTTHQDAAMGFEAEMFQALPIAHQMPPHLVDETLAATRRHYARQR